MGGLELDKTMSQEGAAADAAAVGAAVAGVQAVAERAQATAEAVTPAGIGAEEKRLQFTDVVVSSFEENATHEDFPWRAAVALEGVTADMIPEVIFGVEDVINGNFAPVAECYDGGVYIYASEEATATIPVIILWR